MYNLLKLFLVKILKKAIKGSDDGYVEKPKRWRVTPNILTVEEFNLITNSLFLDSYND